MKNKSQISTVIDIDVNVEAPSESVENGEAASFDAEIVTCTHWGLEVG